MLRTKTDDSGNSSKIFDFVLCSMASVTQEQQTAAFGFSLNWANVSWSWYHCELDKINTNYRLQGFIFASLSESLESHVTHHSCYCLQCLQQHVVTFPDRCTGPFGVGMGRLRINGVKWHAEAFLFEDIETHWCPKCSEKCRAVGGWIRLIFMANTWNPICFPARYWTADPDLTLKTKQSILFSFHSDSGRGQVIIVSFLSAKLVFSYSVCLPIRMIEFLGLFCCKTEGEKGLSKAAKRVPQVERYKRFCCQLCSVVTNVVSTLFWLQ